MEWLDRVMLPMRRVWIGIATRLGVRRTGLGKLSREVRTCEYEDVRVMWELLSKADSGKNGGGRQLGRGRNRRREGRRRTGHVWAVIAWARRGATFNFCHSF